MASSTSASAAVSVSSASPIGAGAALAELVDAALLVSTGIGEIAAAAPARPSRLRRPRRDRAELVWESTVAFGIFPSQPFARRLTLSGQRLLLPRGVVKVPLPRRRINATNTPSRFHYAALDTAPKAERGRCYPGFSGDEFKSEFSENSHKNISVGNYALLEDAPH